MADEQNEVSHYLRRDAVAMAAALDITTEQAEAILREEGVPAEYLSEADVANLVKRVRAITKTDLPIEKSSLKFSTTIPPSMLVGAPVARVDDDFIEDEGVQSHFAMAAASSKSDQSTQRKPGFFPIGTVQISGTDHQILTDGRRIAIRLNPKEQPIGLWLDEDCFELKIAAGGKLAVIQEYWRGDADGLLLEIAQNRSSHILRWNQMPSEDR